MNRGDTEVAFAPIIWEPPVRFQAFRNFFVRTCDNETDLHRSAFRVDRVKNFIADEINLVRFLKHFITAIVRFH